MAHNAWNPGLQSDIPAALMPLVTLFREVNATLGYPVASELADLTGLMPLELIALRPERLVVHALLVWVTADLSVPDGPDYEVLGINLRGMVDRIYRAYMQPEMPSIVSAFEAHKADACSYVERQLAEQLFDRSVDQHEQAADAKKSRSLLRRLFAKPVAAPRVTEPEKPVELTAINHWKALALNCDDSLHSACLYTMVRTVDAIVGHRGRLIPDASLIRDIVVNQVANTHGAMVIESFIEPIWQRAIKAEGYRLLPAQSKPVIMNVKGASASGKSTIRPQQRQLANQLGIPWEDFALISPDYWRKYLLDYGSLGDDYKYGAMLTGRELEIIDRKLDRYMAGKAANKSISHLLIDRFRFDSFNVSIDKPSDSTLLSRFGDRVYLFFMVTHPAETVERAWARGIKTGRYKAVDDLLYHNVEAYTGMPSLFLSWVNSRDKQIHFEFLDNDVAQGQLPRTAAFGWNNSLTILDVRLLLNIDRYRKVNIAARQADEMLKTTAGDPADNTQFIVNCAQRVPRIVFADQLTAHTYATVIDGKLVWWDHDYIQLHAGTEGLVQALVALGYPGEACADSSHHSSAPIDVDKEKAVTVGSWAVQE